VTLHTLPLDGDGQTSPLVRTQGNEARARISPDGRWIAYDLAQTGRREVFVQPFPDVDGARSKVSTDGGSNPIWSLAEASCSMPFPILAVTDCGRSRSRRRRSASRGIP